MTAGCLVCRQLADVEALPGGALHADELVVAYHRPPLPGEPGPYLGHLLVVTRRHADQLADLSEEEAARAGAVCARLARALRAEPEVERVYSAVAGHGVPHFHQHLFPRYAGTPREVAWHSVDEWEGAPRGGESEVAALAERLRGSVSA